MSYKYIMNPSSQRFSISSFLTFLAYIFSESISLKYHCTFSLYKVTNPLESPNVHNRGPFAGANYQLLGFLGTT